ncbi:MAG: Hpt domain-containing protein, partial [Cyanobacteria bacterium P01_A01_bin.83]
MITDPSIRDQAYQYFLEEAPELLETIEQELFAINDGEIELSDRPLRVNKLMRATHTLKGGAANVGLETIKTVAHSMEDVFKALYNPELEIDLQTKKLLYASYDCLRIPLTAEFSKAPIDREEILNRAAGIFAELTEIFGDYLSDQDAFPTSEELGLDVVESFFESVVPERIQELSVALSEDDSETMREVLQSQAEIFLGLSESLNLSGLGDIAQTILSALEANPDQVTEITQAAIANLQQAQQQVMDGDRDRGGEPSPELQKFAGGVDSIESHQEQSELSPEDSESMFAEVIVDENDQDDGDVQDIFGSESLGDDFIGVSNSVADEDQGEDAQDIFGSESLGDNFAEASVSVDDAGSFFEESESPTELMTQIWGDEEVEQQIEQPTGSPQPQAPKEIETALISTPQKLSKQKASLPQEVSTRDIRKSRFSSKAKKDKSETSKNSKNNKTVRVNLESLEKLNDLVGELLINQNKNIL